MPDDRFESLAADLRAAGERRVQADDERADALHVLRQKVRDAVDAGMPVTRVAREAGLSRTEVYNVLGGRRGGP